MMEEKELIHDWNVVGNEISTPLRSVELDDETLRDGLQDPSVTDPPLEDKIHLLHLMEGLGIHTAAIGLPGAGPRAVRDVTALAREIVEAKLRIRPNCAARTVLADIRPIVEISQAVGVAIEACTFIGSSPIRQYVEGWTLERMLTTSEEAVTFAGAGGDPGDVRHRGHHPGPPGDAEGALRPGHRVGRPADLPGRTRWGMPPRRGPGRWCSS